MPMAPGYSKRVIRKNTEAMIQSGHDPKQAYRASIATAKEYAKKKGVKPEHLCKK